MTPGKRVLRLRVAMVVAALAAASTVSAQAVQAAPRPAADSAVATPVIVEVTAASDPATIAAKHGVTPIQVFTEVVNGFSADVSAKQMTALRADPAVQAVDADRVVGRNHPPRIRPGGGPSNPGQPPESLPGQPAQFVTAAIRRVGTPASPTADIDGLDDRRVNADIAVLDGGVDAYHPDLDVVGGFDCVRGPRSQRGYYDRDGHGTLVAGFAAAIDNGIGLVGTAPGARIWAVRVADPAGFVTESSVLCGLEYVVRNRAIDVANLSFGGDVNPIGPCTSKPQRTRDRIHQQICRVVSKGVTVVAAAGNDAADASSVTPAAYGEVIAVSAIADFNGLPGGGTPPPSQCLQTEQDDHLATFSNFGPPVDIAAPGVCVTSTLPGGNYATADGTSFSAPFVAGGAALILARRPGTSPAQVRAQLLARAERGPIPGDPDAYPEGILNLAGL